MPSQKNHGRDKDNKITTPCVFALEEDHTALNMFLHGVQSCGKHHHHVSVTHAKRPIEKEQMRKSGEFHQRPRAHDPEYNWLPHS
jgi:hypothetical protein